MRDEFALSPSHKHDNPTSLILQALWWKGKQQQLIKLNSRSKKVRDEFTFNASDNEGAPWSPISLFMKEDYKPTPSKTKSNVQISKGWIDHQCFW